MEDALAELTAAAVLAEARAKNVRKAREGGATWEQIAKAARMSRAAVINLSKK